MEGCGSADSKTDAMVKNLNDLKMRDEFFVETIVTSVALETLP